MERHDFYDSRIVGVDLIGTELRLAFERVSVLTGDCLVREECGVLRLEGLEEFRVDDVLGSPRLVLEFGRVLSWELGNGKGSFLIEWHGFRPKRWQVVDFTFRFCSSSWFPHPCS